MSKATFSFPAAEPTEDEPQPAGRRRLPLVVGAAGVLALAVVGVLVLGGGSSDDELGLGVPAGAAQAAEPADPAPSPSASAAPPAPDSAEVQRGRDPFRSPLGTTPGGTAAGEGAGTGGSAPVPAAPPEGGAVPVDEAAPEGPLDPGTDAAPSEQARSVSLLGVGADQSAELSVDGARQSVRVGDAFGPGGALLLLSLQQGPDVGQWTAVVQLGSGEPFDVVSGQPASIA